MGQMSAQDMGSTFHTQGITAETVREYYKGREVAIHDPSKFDATTTTRDTYVRHPLAPPTQYAQAPPRAPTHFEGTTTYHDAYHPYDIQPRQAHAAQGQYTGTTGEFDGTTTYNTEFPGYMPERRPQPVAAQARAQHPFDATTSYQQDYYEKSMPQRSAAGPAQVARPSLPFDAHTSYGDTYHAHALPERMAFQPPPARPHQPFEGATTHQLTYVEHPMERRAPHQPASYRPTDVPFDATTTYGDYYHPHQLEQRPPPAQPVPKPTTHFDGTTTYHDQYVAKELAPRVFAGPTYTQRPDVPLDASTTYGTNFTTHPLPERMAYAPPPQRASQPFDATTTHNATFVPHQIQPRPVHGPAYAERPHVPFDATTTMHDAFQAYQLEPRAARALPPMRPQVPFEGTTTNADTFRGWQLPAKHPAIGIELMGDRMYTLIPRGASLPYVGKHIFSTAHDNQESVCILIVQGDSPVASKNEVIGQFDLTKVPQGKANHPQIEVVLTMGVDHVLSATARDLDTNRHYQWLENGRMVVRTLSDRVHEVMSPPSSQQSEHLEYEHHGEELTMYPPAHAGIEQA